MKLRYVFLPIFLIGFLVLSIFSCSFFSEPAKPTVSLSSLRLSLANAKIQVGGMEYIGIVIAPASEQKNAGVTWNYDNTIISVSGDNFGAVITGKKEGETVLTAQAGGLSASCKITVSGTSVYYESDPYIYSNYSIVEMKPNVTQRINVSLYGGTATDANGFTWSIDKPAIATLEANGQYCNIISKTEGSALITVTHSKAAFSYNILVYVYANLLNSTYITTANNIVSLYRTEGEKTITVDLKNPVGANYTKDFAYSIVDTEGNPTANAPIQISTNNQNIILTPISNGQCFLRVTHPSASYQLDILIRVITIVENVYITPSSTLVYLSADKPQTITATLSGSNKVFSPDEFVWENKNDSVVSSSAFGNQIMLLGIANGAAKIVVSHPAALYSREIMVVVRDQSFVDASAFITTSQNYVRTKVGASITEINIMLSGGTIGDERNFTWDIVHTPTNGSGNVINANTSTGNIISRAASSYSFGKLIIEPVGEGSAVITVSHPKALYPTEILIKVLPQYALLDYPMYIQVTPIVLMLNGSITSVTATLSGNTAPNDIDTLVWKSENTPVVSVAANGGTAQFSANGTGQNQTYVTISHQKAEVEKRILVLTADTQDELDNMKTLFAAKTSYSVCVEDVVSMYLSSYGLSETDTQNIRYTIDNPQIASFTVHDDYLGIDVTALKTGVAKITATVQGFPQIKPVYINLTVYPKGTNPSEIVDEGYITTGNNVVSFNKTNLTKTVSVNLISIQTSRHYLTEWKVLNPSVASIVYNGTSATLTSIAEGETIIEVTHPDAANTLKIMCRIGDDFIYNNPTIVYIEASKEVVSIVKGASQTQINAMLVNSNTTTGFTFAINNPAIADITSYSNGICFVKGKEAGQALITITHPESELSKQVIVLVGNTQAEIDGIKYLSTAQNVVTMVEGSTQNVSVQVRNASAVIIDGYTWETQNPAVATVFASGATAIITGNAPGTTKITVKNSECVYPLEIIVTVVNAQQSLLNPFIRPTQDIVTLTVNASNWTTLEAALVGGTEADNANFTWSIQDASLAQLLGQGKTARIKATAEGTTFVTITHPKSQYTARMLLICEKVTASNCYISVPESIITMKPTDSAKNITATLINGTAEDKYNFTWYADTYDVVELNYSANVASIRPIGQGQTTIHIKHPKAAYEQQLIVKVSEYTTFAFAQPNKTVTQGTVSFISMQVPVTQLQTHVEYETMNDRIVSISGTRAVSQLTGVGEGTTTVKAKLVTTATNVVQATAEMLIYVEKSNASLTYITSSMTTHTLEKTLTKRLTANLTGANVEPTDVYNLKWISSDASVVKILGASTTGVAVGSEIMIQAVNSGECTITVSHEKSNTDLVLYIIVPGQNEMEITLNKTYIRIESGASTEIKATLTNGSNADYKAIVWELSKADNTTIGTILGQGQTVALYAQKAGSTKLRATLPNGKYAECEVLIEASRSFTFDAQQIRVFPGQTKTFNYTVSPPDASIDWLIVDDTYYSFTVNTDAKTVAITGIKEMGGNASSKLTGVTQYGNKATMTVFVNWDYDLQLYKSFIKSEPKYDPNTPDKFVIPYSVTPENARIEVDLIGESVATYYIDEQAKKIILTPVLEGTAVLKVRAYNQATNQVFPNMERQVTLNFVYNSLTLDVKNITKDGNFSYYDPESKTMYIGDGEDINFELGVKETNTSIQIESVVLNKSVGYSTNSLTRTVNTYKIKHPTDTKEEGFIIHQWYDVYNGATKIDPFATKWYFQWDEERAGLWPGYHYYCKCYAYLSGSINGGKSGYAHGTQVPGTMVRNSARDGEWVSQNTLWNSYFHIPSLWCSGHAHDSPTDHGNKWILPYTPVNAFNPSKTVVSSAQTDVLTVTILRSTGKRDIYQIPVITQTRNCSKYQN